MSVTPDGATASQRLQNTSGYSESFLVTNTGTLTDNFEVSCYGSSNVTCTGTSRTSFTLAAGASRTVQAYYNVGSAGTGTLTLTGWETPGDEVSNNGSFTVPVVTILQYADSVSPKLANITRPPQSGGVRDTFTVVNTGSSSDTYTLSAYCGFEYSTCYSETTTLTLAGNGGSAKVAIVYSTTSTLTTTPQSLSLTATSAHATATGTSYVTVGLPLAAPLAVLKNQNDSLLDRSLCLTTGAGEAAANQCGDLLVTHGMPGFSTLGRDRSLSLLYNSRQARPFQVEVVTVTEGGTMATPDSVNASLFVNGGTGLTLRRQTSWTPWGNPGGVSYADARQLSLAYDASFDSTGVYPFVLSMQNVYNEAGHYADTLTGNLLVVNRANSQLGRGWSLAGVERLYFNQPVSTPDQGILWVGGDGSARLYRKTATNTWVAPAEGFRDTLTYSGGEYTRGLRHGITVVFDAQGRHVRTTTRAQQVTRFFWNAVRPFQLDSIVVPPGGQAWRTYKLTYSATTAKLIRITDPVGRTLQTTMAANGTDLAALTDPDGKVTGFTYLADGHMASRASSRGYTTTYGYASGIRLNSISVPRDSTHSDVTTIAPWDMEGYSPGEVGQVPGDTSLSRTLVYGPRIGVADDAYFWVDKFGAPWKTVNADGNTTLIERGNTTYPAAVTKVTYPTGWTVRMVYGARGNLAQVIDSTGEAGRPLRSMSYLYADANAPDSPSQVTDGLGRVNKYAYNSFGITDSTIDSRGHRTKYTYKPVTDSLRGVLLSVTERNVQTWQEPVGAPLNDTTDAVIDQTESFSYDARGSVKTDSLPTGVRTSYVSDSIGRVAEIYDPLNTRSRRFYDLMNRVTETRQYTAAGTNPYGNPLAHCVTNQSTCADSTRIFNPGLPDTMPASASTWYRYKAAGLDSIADPRGVSRKYRFNGQGLVNHQTDEYGISDTTWYNAVGAVDSTRSRSGVVVRSHYDVMGRRTSTVYPARAWSGLDATHGAWTDLADSVSYSYDAMGHLLVSHNRTGTITRTYYKDGSLKQQTTASPGGADVLSYEYDATGARSRVVHGNDTTDYAYNATSGDLAALTVRLGSPAATTRQFQFVWDSLGRRRQITYPSDLAAPLMRVLYRYDAAGILRRVVSVHPDAPSRPAGLPDVFDFKFRNRVVDPAGRILQEEMSCSGSTTYTGNPCGSLSATSMTHRYNRLGYLVVQTSIGSVDTMRYDLSGNMTYRHAMTGAPSYTFQVDNGRNRMVRNTSSQSGFTVPMVSDYTNDGDRQFTHPLTQDNTWREVFYYYDGLGRMTGEAGWADAANWVNHFDACRYDADGQMTLPCDNGASYLAFDGSNHVRTFIGAGGWSFVHGGGLDDPLMGYFRPASGSGTRILYWVTDGHGRQFAVADSAGFHQDADDTYDLGTWRYAGTTTAPNTFNSSRLGNTAMPGLSFFRNRAYDSKTGRWTQEDPIGVAGGINLYQFNGNNPVTFTDPFGLSGCKRTTYGWALALCLAMNVVQDIAEKRGVRHVTPSMPDPSVLGTSGEAAARIKTGVRIRTSFAPGAGSGNAFQRLPSAAAEVAEGTALRGAVPVVARVAGAVGTAILMSLIPDQQMQGAAQCEIEHCDPGLDPNLHPAAGSAVQAR